MVYFNEVKRTHFKNLWATLDTNDMVNVASLMFDIAHTGSFRANENGVYIELKEYYDDFIKNRKKEEYRSLHLRYLKFYNDEDISIVIADFLNDYIVASIDIGHNIDTDFVKLNMWYRYKNKTYNYEYTECKGESYTLEGLYKANNIYLSKYFIMYGYVYNYEIPCPPKINKYFI